MDKDKINDIILDENTKKNLVVDVTPFFERPILKAIKLNQKNLFSDLYLELQEKIDLSKKQFLKISSLKDDITKDIFKKIKPKLSISKIIWKGPRMLAYTVNAIEPLWEVQRNTIDVRQLETIASEKTYPDLYRLPLLPKQKIKKFYKDNNEAIKKLYEEHNEDIKKWLSKWAKILIISGVTLTTLAFLIVWYKNYMQAEVTKAYTWLYALKWNKDPQSFKENARKLRSKFRILNLLFLPTKILWDNFIYSNSKIATAASAISGWEKISNIVFIAWSVWSDFENEIKDIQKWKKSDDTESFTFLSRFKFTEFLKKESRNIDEINAWLKDSIKQYSKIWDLWNPSLNEKLSQTLEAMIKLQQVLEYTIKNKQIILKALWDSSPVRYLILNQNKDELRANWWFPWSVITLELYKWSILNYDKKDIYYYDWHNVSFREPSPEWINVISPFWWLRDSNYMPSIKDSFEKINFFYEKWGWWSIDTIIWINQWIIEDILKTDLSI